MVDCPDCKKKMTKQKLKYAHAKNCTAKMSAPSVLPAVKEAEEEEDEEEEPETEEEEEVKPSPILEAPILKRTVNVAHRDPPQPTIQKVSKQPPPVKKNCYQSEAAPTPTTPTTNSNEHIRPRKQE